MEARHVVDADENGLPYKVNMGDIETEDESRL